MFLPALPNNCPYIANKKHELDDNKWVVKDSTLLRRRRTFFKHPLQTDSPRRDDRSSVEQRSAVLLEKKDNWISTFLLYEGTIKVPLNGIK